MITVQDTGTNITLKIRGKAIQLNATEAKQVATFLSHALNGRVEQPVRRVQIHVRNDTYAII